MKTELQKVAAFKRRTQDTFNKQHREPMYYGNEGEWMVVGAQYSEKEALRLISEQLASDDPEAELPNDVALIGIGVGRNEDGNIGYCIAFGGVVELSCERWKAWVADVYN